MGINVVGDKQVEPAVAIVVDEGAPGIPALAIAGDAGFFAHVGKGAVAVVVVENILAKISDEEIFEAVIVVIANADALSPARVRHTRLGRDIGESAITIVFEQMRRWLLSGGKTFQAPAVYQKNIQPAVVVVVIKSDAATCGLQQVFF